MDEDKASRFISSLVKSIQALCNGFVDFSTSIEVVGHIHLNIDRSVKLDYVLTEEVSKSVSEGSTVFSSHSYHSQPPPSVASKSASDTSNSQKSRKDSEADPLGLSALPREVPNASKSDIHFHGSSRVSESSNSSHSFSGNVGFSRNSDSEKQENSRLTSQVEDSASKRRKMGPLSQTPSPANKRSRTNDFGPGSRTVVKEPGFEVIEIKEEPDEEPPTFFGSSAPGQDIQTPDFSNVVMESLDRVNQIEQGTDLVGDSGGGEVMTGPQQPVFPVMFHQSDGLSSSSSAPVPGPSSDPQSVASTSGASFHTYGGYQENPEQHEDLPPHEAAALTLTRANGSQHFLERGEGLNHRCAVCERKHSTFLKLNPPGMPNPYKRKKTRYRCAACKVYLCTSVRECWWIWHQENMESSLYS